MPQLGDQQLQMRHHRLGAGGAGFRLAARQLLGRKRGAQRVDVVGQGVGSGRHDGDSSTSRQGT